MKLWIATLVTVVAAYVSIQTLLVSRMYYHFDSSYNLILARTFAQTGHYATNLFLLAPEEFFPFDAWITTGYPVLAPLGVIWMFTGSIEQIARFYMTLWGSVFILISASILKQLFPSISFLTILAYSLSLFYFTGVYEGSVHTLGEIPSAIFLLIAVAIYQRALMQPIFSLLFGLCLGLAGVTKLMTVFAAMPFGLFFIVHTITRSNKQAALLACVGGILPFLAQAIWISTQMPLNEWWFQQRLVWQTQGAEIVFKNFSSIQALLSRLLATAQFDFIFFIATVTLLLLTFKKSALLFRPEIIPLVSMLFFLVFFRSYDHARHMYISKFFLLLILGPYFATTVLKITPDRWSARLRAFFAMAIFILILLAGWRISPDLAPSAIRISQDNFGNFLKDNLKERTIFFPGWWKAPEAQLISDRRFIKYNDYSLKSCTGNCILIVDPLMQRYSPQDVTTIEQEFGKPLLKRDGYILFSVP